MATTIHSHEVFVEGSLVVGAVRFKIYYEYSLGYLALMSGDREALEAVAAKMLPFVRVGRVYCPQWVESRHKPL